MESAFSTALNPALLPPGTQRGPWRVVDWAGRGVHGAVYRAVRVGAEQVPPVALKLSLNPGDPRFVREAELLSRQHHPNIPRLVDHGDWEHPGGTRYPYVAMEWIDGVPLYDWARLYHPSPEQQLRLLAQIALALQALHATGAVHRDVKGANVLVRRSDSRVFLTDFGSGIYPGADTLTPPSFQPGTPAYRSPEAWLFSLQHNRTPAAPYSAGPEDDLFALGVTACRLLTGAYPQMGEAQKDEHGTWFIKSLVLPQALFSARVPPRVRELILRLLSVRPEQRGTAAQLAQDLEHAAASLSVPSHSHAHRASWQFWLAAAAVAGALAVWMAWMAPGTPGGSPRVAQAETTEPEQADAGPVGLGETAASTSTEDSPGPSLQEVLAADTLPEPQPGQAKPDAKGRCPHKRQVILNGGCWARLNVKPEDCAVLSGHLYRGSCYVPILPPGHPPTTAPPPPP